MIALVLGDFDGRRPEEVISRFAGRFGSGTLDHLATNLKPDHPLLLLRVPVHDRVADFHHGMFLHEGLRDGLCPLVLSGDCALEATASNTSVVRARCNAGKIPAHGPLYCLVSSGFLDFSKNSFCSRRLT